ncbi:MAG: serine/threonine-protein kinase, partial [Planctomycetota bacterium]
MDEPRFPFLNRDDGHAADDACLGMMGRFRVERLLGQGGMGYVFEALDTMLERSVALKVIKPHVASKRENLDRFVSEAKSLASIRHPNVVTIYDVGYEGRFPFLAMELLEGQSLADWIASKGTADANASDGSIETMNPEEAIRLMIDVCAGLSAAHRVGIIHRDIKPSNLWLDSSDNGIRLLDFGLARDRRNGVLGEGCSVVGTPAYLSPEQARGEPVTFRTDLYAVGVILYRLLSGQLPHEEPTPAKQLAAIVIQTPRPLQQLNEMLPGDLCQLTDCLLAKRPTDRPDSADDVADQLKRILDSIGEAKRKQGTPAHSFPKLEATPLTVERTSQTLWRITGRLLGVGFVSAGVSGGLALLCMPMLIPPAAVSTEAPPLTRDAKPVSLDSPKSIAYAQHTYPVRDGGQGFFEVSDRATGDVEPADFVSIRNQPGIKNRRSCGVLQFDLQQEKATCKHCVDAMITMTMKGGLSSNQTRTFHAYLLNDESETD